MILNGKFEYFLLDDMNDTLINHSTCEFTHTFWNL